VGHFLSVDPPNFFADDRLHRKLAIVCQYGHNTIPPCLVPPEILEPAQRQRRIAGRVLDVAAPEVGLHRPGTDPVVRQLEAAAVAQERAP
jgi:hypothetical protein